MAGGGAGKLSGVTVAETVLVFVGAPLSIVLLFALLTIGPGVRERRPRYKPGQTWNHDAIWYEPHPQGGGHDGATAAIGSSVHGAGSAPQPAGPLGGARGTW